MMGNGRTNASESEASATARDFGGIAICVVYRPRPYTQDSQGRDELTEFTRITDSVPPCTVLLCRCTYPATPLPECPAEDVKGCPRDWTDTQAAPNESVTQRRNAVTKLSLPDEKTRSVRPINLLPL